MITLPITAEAKDDRRVELVLLPEVPLGRAELVVTVESPSRQLDDADSVAQSAKRCSFCRKAPRKTGPLVEGPGPNGAGGVLICRECATMALSIIGIEDQRIEEKRRRK